MEWKKYHPLSSVKTGQLVAVEYPTGFLMSEKIISTLSPPSANDPMDLTNLIAKRGTMDFDLHSWFAANHLQVRMREARHELPSRLLDLSECPNLEIRKHP